MRREIQTELGLVQFGDFELVAQSPGRYFNDHCLFQHAGQWHLFAIVGPVGTSCYDSGSEFSFAHLTSPDLIKWSTHPDILQVTGEGPDSHHVFAPHVIAHDGGFWLFYTGVDGSKRQSVCTAYSTDLFEWHRSPQNPIIVPSMYWAKWPGHGDRVDAIGNCRDAHVMRLDDGRFVAYWVAELHPHLGEDTGCCVASVSRDLLHWQEYGPVFALRHAEQYPTRAVESPCVVHKDGKFWLFFKHGWWTYVVRANSPFDFYNQPAVRLGFAHAAEVFERDDRWYITHCSADPRDYRYTESNRTRGLYVASLEWPANEYPRLSAG